MGPSASSSAASCPEPEDPIPAPTPGPLPQGPGLEHHPPWTLLRSSPKMLAFPPPCWALKGAASEARSEARQAAPGGSDPAVPPKPRPCTLTLPQAGHTDPSWRPALAPSVSESPSCFRGLLPLVKTLNVSPAAFTVLGAGPCHPISTQHLFMCLPPPTRCLGDCVLLGTLVHRTAPPWSHEPE